MDIHFNRFIVSAFRDDAEKQDAGSCYLYVYDGEEVRKLKRLHSNDSKAGDMFGSDVAIHTNYALVGASGEDFKDAKDAGMRL